MKLFGRLFLGLTLATCIGFAGCGGAEAEKKKEAPATPAADAPKEGASNDSATGDEMVLVSLKLPNMT